MADTKKTKTVKKTETKIAVKTPVKKTVAAKTAAKPAKIVKTAKQSTLSIDLFDASGKKSGTLALPEAMFGAKINKTLMAQARRVYLANQRLGTASTKSRGEVRGSTRKIYRQKGTGRARHGGVRAPIFVHGGIAFGPKPHDFSLSLSKKMRKAALFSALSTRCTEGQIKAISGLEKVPAKTKEFVSLLGKLDMTGSKILVIMSDGSENVSRGVKNIKQVTLTPVQGLSTYEVLNAETVLLMKDAVPAMEKHFGGAK